MKRDNLCNPILKSFVCSRMEMKLLGLK